MSKLSFILNFAFWFVVLFPLWSSFRGIYIDYNYISTIEELIINTLFAFLLSAFVGVLKPTDAGESKFGIVLAIIFAIITISSFSAPTVVIEFHGLVNGKLISRNFIQFLYSNFHYFLWVYLMSFFIEREVKLGGENE